MKRYIQNFTKYRFLLSELVKKGIALKYRRSYLGVLWTLIEPLLTMIVLTIVFGTLFGNKDKQFPVYILSGRLLYSFFSNSTKVAMRSIRTHSGMIKKVYVPKYMYPLSSVLTDYIIFLISLIVLVLVAAVLRVKPTIYLLQIVVPLILLPIMAFGIGLILATFSVFFRDLEYIWTVALMLVMYTSAIFYKPARIIKAGYGWLLEINPLYSVVVNFRNSIFGSPLDQRALVLSLLYSFGFLFVGVFIFVKKQDEFILHV
ncbi:MAG: Transport permease protein [Lachnoclostridium sp.]